MTGEWCRDSTSVFICHLCRAWLTYADCDLHGRSAPHLHTLLADHWWKANLLFGFWILNVAFKAFWKLGLTLPSCALSPLLRVLSGISSHKSASHTSQDSQTDHNISHLFAFLAQNIFLLLVQWPTWPSEPSWYTPFGFNPIDRKHLRDISEALFKCVQTLPVSWSSWLKSPTRHKVCVAFVSMSFFYLTQSWPHSRWSTRVCYKNIWVASREWLNNRVPPPSSFNISFSTFRRGLASESCGTKGRARGALCPGCRCWWAHCLYRV